MYFPQAKWLGLLGAVVNAARAVEVDLVFPRNETYSPADWFPVVFAVQNTQNAELLNLRISYDVRKGDDRSNDTTLTHDLRWANWSSSADPYLAYHYLPDVNTTGSWSVTWRLYWQSCDQEALAKADEDEFSDDHDGGVLEHYYSWVQSFMINDSSPKSVDLVAKTAEQACPFNQNGIAITVTNTTMQSPAGLNSAGRDTCVVTANSTASGTTTTWDPCRVAIDSDTAASMAAVQQQRLCDGPNPPENCPDKENAARPLAVFGGSGLLAAVGVVAFALL